MVIWLLLAVLVHGNDVYLFSGNGVQVLDLPAGGLSDVLTCETNDRFPFYSLPVSWLQEPKQIENDQVNLIIIYSLLHEKLIIDANMGCILSNNKGNPMSINENQDKNLDYKVDDVLMSKDLNDQFLIISTDSSFVVMDKLSQSIAFSSPIDTKINYAVFIPNSSSTNTSNKRHLLSHDEDNFLSDGEELLLSVASQTSHKMLNDNNSTDTGNHCFMSMTLDFSNDVCFIFQKWHITNGAQFFGTMLFIITFAFLREYVNYLRIKRVQPLSVFQSLLTPRESQGDFLVAETSFLPKEIAEQQPGEYHSFKDRGDIKHVVIKIKGMTCQSCVQTLENGLKSNSSIRKAHISLLRETAEVVYDSSAMTVQDVFSIIESLGYEAELRKEFDRDIYLLLSGMTCDTCVQTIEKQLRNTEHVIDAKVDLKTRVAKVSLDPRQVQVADLIRGVESVGYHAEEINEAAAAKVKNIKPRSTRWTQANDSFLYALLIFFAYSLMLVLMTYNAGLIITMLTSMTVANFIFLFFIPEENKSTGDEAAHVTESDHCCDK